MIKDLTEIIFNQYHKSSTHNFNDIEIKCFNEFTKIKHFKYLKFHRNTVKEFMKDVIKHIKDNNVVEWKKCDNNHSMNVKFLIIQLCIKHQYKPSTLSSPTTTTTSDSNKRKYKHLSDKLYIIKDELFKLINFKQDNDKFMTNLYGQFKRIIASKSPTSITKSLNDYYFDKYENVIDLTSDSPASNNSNSFKQPSFEIKLNNNKYLNASSNHSNNIFPAQHQSSLITNNNDNKNQYGNHALFLPSETNTNIYPNQPHYPYQPSVPIVYPSTHSFLCNDVGSSDAFDPYSSIPPPVNTSFHPNLLQPQPPLYNPFASHLGFNYNTSSSSVPNYLLSNSHFAADPQSMSAISGINGADNLLSQNNHDAIQFPHEGNTKNNNSITTRC